MVLAARTQDTTRCEHGEGAIDDTGCPSVKIEGRPSARLADRSRCPKGPDTLAEGARTVLVGGLPASRQGDRTLHGGAVASGSGVKIGGPKITGKAIGNSVVAWDPAAGRMFVVSRLELHGPGATPALAEHHRRQIEETWSGSTTIDGRPARVTVQVAVRCNPSGPPTPGHDRIAIDPATSRPSRALGGGSGREGVVPLGKVAAHLYGHTLGLEAQTMETEAGPAPDPRRTRNLERNIMTQAWDDPDGSPARTYPEHYEAILKAAGLR